MRESYVYLFQDIRQSSLWALDSDIRMVWFTLLTMVDPEGYVCAAIPGIAVAANVPVAKVREAMALFESPDPDSRSTAHEGRRIEKVPRGWRLLNLEEHRRRAREEAERARKRRWAQNNRAANDAGLDSPDDRDGDAPLDAASTPRSGTVDASESESESGSVVVVESAQKVIVKNLDNWEPSEELRQAALTAGVPDFDQRIAELRRGPIGGSRGIFRSELDGYIRALFPKWKNWRETAAFKAQSVQSKQARGARYPIGMDLVTRAHTAYAKKWGLELSGYVAAALEEDLPEKVGLGRAREIIGERMARDARKAGKKPAA